MSSSVFRLGSVRSSDKPSTYAFLYDNEFLFAILKNVFKTSELSINYQIKNLFIIKQKYFRKLKINERAEDKKMK